MDNVKCPYCGLINFATAKVCKRCDANLDKVREEIVKEENARKEAIQREAMRVEELQKHKELHPQRRKILLSTGEVQYQYRVIDIIFAYGNSSQGFFRNVNPMEAYKRVSDMLEQNAAQIEANAVLWVKYDYRVAINQGFLTTNQVFEVFAYGTAVKLL